MGTFGDVRPFLALAYGLEERGHAVTLAGPENFLSYIAETYQRPYVPIGLDSQRVLESEEGRRWMAAGDSKQFLKQMAQITHESRFALERDAMLACENCDLIVAHPLMVYYACVLSEKLHKPLVLANTFPVSPATSAFPHFLARTKKLPFGFLNKASYRLVNSVYEKSVRKDMNEWRAKLGGLEPMRGTLYNKLERQKVPVMQAFSPALVPPPGDWGDNVLVTGQWKIPARHVPEQEQAALPGELQTWLDAGPSPIYFGFGSLPVLEPQKMIGTVIDIARALQSRAILASGWSAMDTGGMPLPDSIRMIKSANHELLFPRCSLVVHHGGAGTTHTAAENGIPAIVCSTYADQPFWGERLAELGIGAHIPFPSLGKENLLASIRKLQAPDVRRRAAEIASRIKAESGLRTALDFLERQAPTAPVYKN